TYADDPARFVPGEAAQKGFRANVDDYAQRLWRQLEAVAGQPWFLLGTGYLCRGDDPLAAAPRLVCCRMSATACDRVAGRRGAASGLGMAAELRPAIAGATRQRWLWSFGTSLRLSV